MSDELKEPLEAQEESPLGSSSRNSAIQRRLERREERFLLGELRSSKARDAIEKLLARIGTGAVYMALTMLCLFLGRVPTAILFAVESWVCCSEFMRMMRKAGRQPEELISLSAAVAFPISALMPSYFSPLICVLLCIACAIWYVGTPRTNISDVAITVFGPIYTGLLFASIVDIRCYSADYKGALLAFFVLGSVWANDSFAYLVGTRYGKHKLAPRISPKKSWEGFFGGMVGSVLVWILLWALKIFTMSLPFAIVSGIAVGSAGVLGDLFESRIKRGVGVKDSGDLLPGHGGLLDRSDSQLFACMTALLALKLGGIL